MDTKPKFSLIVHSIAKKANIGNIIRSGCAFNIHSILVAGSKKNIQTFGSQGTHKHVNFKYFDSLKEAVEYAKQDLNSDICGIEINDKSKNVTEQPFNKNTAFILGNEGTGLSDKQIALCDYFVYIPHYGSGTASLNVAVAGSIVFHHFSLWAKYNEAPRKNDKYLVQNVKDFQKSKTEEIRKERALKKAKILPS